jgi:O-antigen/teichoic acid export membrane protein
MPSLRARAARGVRWNGASLAAATLLQVAQTAVLARLLPPSEFGLMGLVLVATGLAQALSDFGLGGAIIYRQATDRNHLSSLYWANAIGGALILLIVAACAPAAASAYHEPALARLLPAAGLAFLIAPLGQPMAAMLQRDLRFKRLFACEVLGNAGGAAAAVFFAWTLGDAFALVWGQLASVSIRSAALWLLAGWRPSLRLRMEDLRPYLSFGLYQTGQRVVNFLVQNLDKILIGRLLGTSALGYYTVAYQLMARPMFLLNPVITRVAFPIFARMQGDVRRIREAYLEMIRLVAFAMMPLYLAMYAASGPLIRTLLGPAWMPAEAVFKALVLLGLIQCLGNPLDSLMLALGRARLSFWFNVLALALYAAAIPLGARSGLIGVAWAMVIACAGVMVPADLWLRWAVARMTPGEYAKAWLPFLGMGLIAAGVVSAVARFLGGWPDAAALAVLAASGACAFLAMASLWSRAFLGRLARLIAGGA